MNTNRNQLLALIANLDAADAAEAQVLLSGAGLWPAATLSEAEAVAAIEVLEEEGIGTVGSV